MRRINGSETKEFWSQRATVAEAPVSPASRGHSQRAKASASSARPTSRGELLASSNNTSQP